MESNLIKSVIKDVHKLVAKGDTTFTKVCQNSLERVSKNENLNAFITVSDKQSLEKAALLDQQWAATKPATNSQLFGIPISVKDNFCTHNVPTTCGSKMLSTFIPPYSATVVKRLEAADSLILGKTNMDEFAMGSSSTTSFYGPTANYWKRDKLATPSPSQADPRQWHMAGGSSTGSAVSVASGSCFASIGTDTGGSTRQPASLTGVVGFKPTYGLISRFGLIPLVHCLDVVSLLASTVEDVKLIFDTVIGLDENDLTSVNHNKMLKSCLGDGASLPSDFKTISIGVPEKFLEDCDDLSDDVSTRFHEVLKSISGNGFGSINFEIKKLNLDYAKLATECYTIISCAEIASNMSCYDGIKYGFSVDPKEALVKDGENKRLVFDRDVLYKKNRDLGFGPEVKKRILLGNYFLLSANRDKYLTQALKLRRLISDEFDKAFDENQVDIMMMPSTPTTSVCYANWLQRQDDNKLFREDYFLIPSNLANLPSISLPCGLSNEGLPVGMQLISRKFHDYDLLKLSRILESIMFERFQ